MGIKFSPATIVYTIVFFFLTFNTYSSIQLPQFDGYNLISFINLQQQIIVTLSKIFF